MIRILSQGDGPVLERGERRFRIYSLLLGDGRMVARKSDRLEPRSAPLLLHSARYQILLTAPLIPRLGPLLYAIL